MKLDDIPRKNIYRVPEDYFEKLPGIIQSRVSRQQEKRPFFLATLHYSLPALVIILLAVFWIYRFDGKTLGPDETLANIETEALIAYLDNAEITTDELLESFGLTNEDADEIESSVYDFDLDEDDLEIWMDEYNYVDETL